MAVSQQCSVMVMHSGVNSLLSSDFKFPRNHFSMDHPFVFHLVQASLWDETVAADSTYYPPTYDIDGFTHGTANPEKLLAVANHFYPDVEGNWYCLKMTVESLEATGVKTVFEGTAPVGDKQPDFEGSEDELFPHILGGIKPAAVLAVQTVLRDADGTFTGIEGVTDSGS